MVKCQLQCMTGKIFQAEIDTISKSLIIKNMIEGIFLLLLQDFLYTRHTYVNTCALIICISWVEKPKLCWAMILKCGHWYQLLTWIVDVSHVMTIGIIHITSSRSWHGELVLDPLCCPQPAAELQKLEHKCQHELTLSADIIIKLN